MDAASTGWGEVTSREMRAQDRYAWVDAEVQGIASRYCGETEATLRASLSVLDPDYEELYTVSPPAAADRMCHRGETNEGFMFLYAFLVHRLKVRLPFSNFEQSVLKHYCVAPSQLHPNAWGFMKAFSILCELLAIVPTAPLFTHFFDVCPRKAGERGWVSLRGHTGRPLLTLYVDSAKSSGVSFKRDFFKVVPKKGILPSGGVPRRSRSRHLEAIAERAGERYSSRLLVDTSPDQLTIALEEEQMNIRELMKKAKAIGADNLKVKDSKKRKSADESTASLSTSQSLPPPQPIVGTVPDPDPQVEGEMNLVDGERKKKKNKVPPKNHSDRPKTDGGSSSQVPVLTKAVNFDDDFTSEHPAVASQFYTEEIRTKFMKGEVCC
ncbi:putative gypsy type transposon [Sesbania bispinosa]|nr:putative gypsy type transposon [Sesbania bispinosa]